MTNLYNPVDPNSADELDMIDAYLLQHAESDKTLGFYLSVALKRGLSKRDKNLSNLTILPHDAPPWLIEKFGTEPIVVFDPKKDVALDQTVAHVADWISGAMVEQDKDRPEPDTAWIKDLDEWKRPKRLAHLASVEEAFALADKAMERTAKKRKKKNGIYEVALEADPHIEIVKAFTKDKMFMVRLKDTEALDIESDKMGHCVGRGSYDRAVESGATIMYSLRDVDNEPHATLEVRTGGNVLRQCRGKANEPAVERYMPYIQEFVRENKFKLDTSLAETRLLQNKGKYLSIDEPLPDNLVIEGSLSTRDCKNFRFPKNLTVQKTLRITSSEVQSLVEAVNLQFGELIADELDLSMFKEPVAVLEKMRCYDIKLNALVYNPDDSENLKKRLNANRVEYVVLDESGNLHNAEGPASVIDNTVHHDDYVSHDIEKKWFIHGVESRVDGPSTVSTDPQNKAITLEVWKKDGVEHRIDGPSTIRRYGGCGPGDVHLEEWRENGQLLHSKKYGWLTQNVVEEQWLQDGLPHRIDGPSTVLRDNETGVVHFETYQRHGEHYEREDGLPGLIARNAKTGLVERVKFYKDGCECNENGPATIDFIEGKYSFEWVRGRAYYTPSEEERLEWEEGDAAAALFQRLATPVIEEPIVRAKISSPALQ